MLSITHKEMPYHRKFALSLSSLLLKGTTCQSSRVAVAHGFTFRNALLPSSFPKALTKELILSPFLCNRSFVPLESKATRLISSGYLSTASSKFIQFETSTGTSESFGQLVAGGIKAQKKVAWWLFGCCAWVFSMVVLGGVTRLTRSGLSMTDWKFIGSFPPASPEEWQTEFEKYQKSPEYKRVNKGMSVGDFKFIYWMEYGHRMWGRGLGLFFAGPFVYFLCKGFITKRLGVRLMSLLALGAGQGLIGWWMVKSGLEEPESEYAQPKVSPYRLAGHLMSAFVIYSTILWTALSAMIPEPPMKSMDWVRGGSARLRIVALPVAALIGLTAASGAFVAGNDAGHAFNTFPKMGDQWIPEDLMVLQPLARNFFENTATVQFDHRMLAATTLVAITAMWVMARRSTLNPQIQALVNATFGMSLLQVTLGISTLLLYVPVSLGVAHQAGALTLFTLITTLLHGMRRPPRAVIKAMRSRPSVVQS